jgi:hypothetical protein
MRKRLHVKFPLILSDFNETWILSTGCGKKSNIKFHQNPSSGSRVVPCGRTDMKLIVAFRNFVKASKNLSCLWTRHNVSRYTIWWRISLWRRLRGKTVELLYDSIWSIIVRAENKEVKISALLIYFLTDPRSWSQGIGTTNFVTYG